MAPRFDLYVKKALGGGANGGCPFSMRAYMFLLMKTKAENVNAVGIDFNNKSEEFLALNPAGTTPVLVDHEAGDKVIPDSEEVVKYLETVFPDPPMQATYCGAVSDCCGPFFFKFAAYMKNQDASKSTELKQIFVTELNKVEAYLQGDGKGKQFLLGDTCSALDCAIFPRLIQVAAAGKEYKGLDIPGQYPGITDYVQRVSALPASQTVRPTDEDICVGWSRYGPMKEC